KRAFRVTIPGGKMPPSTAAKMAAATTVSWRKTLNLPEGIAGWLREVSPGCPSASQTPPRRENDPKRPPAAPARNSNAVPAVKYFGLMSAHGRFGLLYRSVKLFSRQHKPQALARKPRGLCHADGREAVHCTEKRCV